MSEDHTSLARIVTEELAQPAPNEALVLAAEIRRRHGAAVAAILFYGSCLRTENTEGGVLDFYILVNSYRAAYSSRALAWANALLPPNVFYLEVRASQRTVRAKYAVISTEDFERAASPRGVYSIVWARFCQPALLVYARDEMVRTVVARSVVQAVITMVTRMVALLPTSGDTQRFRPEDLWRRGFEETYRAELRVESPETIRGIYEAAPDRYDRVALETLLELERRGFLQVRVEGRLLHVAMTARQRRRARLGWRIRRPLTKVLSAARLVKSAATFGDWLPYVLWKIERHTGVRIEPSERQRKHPLLWGWPVILKLLLRRELR